MIYLEGDHFYLGYFVDFCLPKYSNYLRCTDYAQVVDSVYVHYSDYSLDGAFVFVA